MNRLRPFAGILAAVLVAVRILPSVIMTTNAKNETIHTIFL